jgi:hypothetical protein
MATSDIFNLTDTWNAGATTFTAIKMDVTDTASASGSLLLDLQVGGSSKFSVSKAGSANAQDVFAASGVYAPTVIQITAAAGRFDIGGDVYLTRAAAASLRLGAADAAAPVAQTLGVQSVVAGTTNTAGTNFTIKGSAGTGTGAGGSLIFQVAPAGSSGTSQNAFATALTIDSTRLATFAGSVAFGSSLTYNVFGNIAINYTAPNYINLSSGSLIAWGSGSVASASDLILGRAAAASLQLGAADAGAAVAQTLGVQSVVAGTSNTAGTNFTIKGSAGTGTGAGGSIIFQVAPAGGSGTAQNAFSTALTIDSNRNVTFGGFAVLGSYIQPSYVRLSDGANDVRIYRAANGVMTLYNAAENDFNRIQFGGTTSSFPALKRNSTALETKLADDSAYAPHAMQYLDVTDGITAPASATGRARIYVDTADGDLKVIFADGTVKTIVTDT